ncbi:uncharacterized protein LOC108906391 [Anoplophora glabripennis]|uniref:uncharacterized protein LOC108906391 n=1 Tax=Anoplophora glabripennis TaxID=217634 RepID=UPI00087425E2|nr:uncharacterized protein LOC108906391 [Anoplophora glabripennis]
MLRQTILLFFVLLLVNYAQCFKIIGNLEAPESGLQKKFEKGGGEQFELAKHAVKGEEGDKGYVSQHAEEKGAKGLHDKEDHQKQYAETVLAGQKQAHNHDDGYYAEQHKAEEGEKGYHFEDKGSYAKGHDTKGHHNVHKLNEYKKKTEFYDEDHDEAHKEKHGGFEASKSENSGGFEKGGHGKKVYLEGKFGKEAKYDKGHELHEDKGFSKAEGEDAFYKGEANYAKKNADEAFKKFGYVKKGDI